MNSLIRSLIWVFSCVFMYVIVNISMVPDVVSREILDLSVIVATALFVLHEILRDE